MSDWMQRAACRDADQDLLFGDRWEQLRAVEVYCRTCPVTQQCRDYALDTRQAYGVWGGLIEGQPPRRGASNVQVREAGHLADCGTRAARDRHRRRGEDCEVCLPPDDTARVAGRILAEVAASRGVRLAHMRQPWQGNRASQPPGFVAAVEAMRRMRAVGVSYERIGRLLGRHHATVMHHCRKEAA